MRALLARRASRPWHTRAVQRGGLQRRAARARRSSLVANARLVDLFSVGPILEGIGLNVTAWSYDGRLNFSLLGCPDLVADLRSVAARLAPALEVLRTSTSSATART